MQKTSDLIWQDTQHQKLFEIIDDLKTEAGDEVVQQLQIYIESHFSLEEEYMRLLDYPGYQAHLDAHNKFREEISKLRSNSPSGELERQALSTFLYQWLKLHVLGIDKELETFILSSHKK